MKKTSRQQFIDLVNGLAATGDPEMVALKGKFDRGEIRLGEGNIFVAKSGSAKATVDMFETKDVKTEGLTNIDKSRLEKDQFFMISSIQLLAVTHGAALTDDILKGTVVYASIKDIPMLANGNSTLKIKSKEVIKDLNNMAFVLDNNQTTRMGELVLDNPQLIRPLDLIEFVIKTGVAITVNTAIKVVLHGTQTLPS